MTSHPGSAAKADAAPASAAEDPAAALEALYRRSYPSYLRVTRAITGDADAAHEAVQEGFARALSAAGRLRSRDALEPWVWRTVVNAARDRRRADRRRRFREWGEDALAAVPSDEPKIADPAVAAAVGGLPERQRLVLFLRYYADLDHRAIATALGIRTGTVGATLHVAHATLRTRLGDGT